MNVLCFSLKSKNKWLSSKSKKDYSMGKRKRTNTDLQKQTTEKTQELRNKKLKNRR